MGPRVYCPAHTILLSAFAHVQRKSLIRAQSLNLSQIATSLGDPASQLLVDHSLLHPFERSLLTRGASPHLTEPTDQNPRTFDVRTASARVLSKPDDRTSGFILRTRNLTSPGRLRLQDLTPLRIRHREARTLSGGQAHLSSC